MSGEVRKYLVNQDNLMLECAADFMQAGWVEVRLASDYAALEAENARLVAQRDAILLQARCWAGEAKAQQSITREVGAILGGIPSWGPIAAGVEAMRTERDAAIAQLAAIQGGMGEVVGFDRNAAYAACPESGCDWGSFYVGWKAAAAQHQRITAAMAAEVERLKNDRDDCLSARLLYAEKLGESMAERNALRAELDRINGLASCGSVQNWLTLSDEEKAKWFALYCDTDKENGELRAELAEVKGRKPDCFVVGKSDKIAVIDSPLPVGTKLYTTPPASPDVEGLVKALEEVRGYTDSQHVVGVINTALSTWRQAQEDKA